LGLPRYRHANENGGQFLFNGVPAGEKELRDMRKEKATYLTQNHVYKRQVMVQEEGAIAADRHGLEEDGVDRLFLLLGERDHALAALQDHEGAMTMTVEQGIGQGVAIGARATAATLASSLGGSAGNNGDNDEGEDATRAFNGGRNGEAAASVSALLHGLDGAAVAARLDQEGVVVEAARAGLRARMARASVPKSWRQQEAEAERKAAARKLKSQPLPGSEEFLKRERKVERQKELRATSCLDVQEERAYMRFLKEGPREDQWGAAGTGSGGKGGCGGGIKSSGARSGGGPTGGSCGSGCGGRARNGFGSLAPAPLVAGERYLQASLPRNHSLQATRALWHQGKKVHLPVVNIV
jgi:hypothetical protein